jgi:hypothetical protein
MKIAMLRVGVDSGCGRMQGPLFQKGDFEFIPIPDDRMLDARTYGNTKGRSGRPLADFFSPGRRLKMENLPIHFDPEFQTFTYGDPNHPKRKLGTLNKGDLLVFYAGLEGFDFVSQPALYLIGYFEVEMAGMASSFTPSQISNVNSAANFVRSLA